MIIFALFLGIVAGAMMTDGFNVIDIKNHGKTYMWDKTYSCKVAPEDKVKAKEEE